MLHSISPLVHVCLRPTHWAFDTRQHWVLLCWYFDSRTRGAPVSGMCVQILQIFPTSGAAWCKYSKLRRVATLGACQDPVSFL